MVTDYIRRRLSIQNKKNRSQDRALGDATSQKRRRGFYFIYSYYLCPALQVRTGERQSRTADTDKVLEARQKNALVDTVGLKVTEFEPSWLSRPQRMMVPRPSGKALGW